MKNVIKIMLVMNSVGTCVMCLISHAFSIENWLNLYLVDTVGNVIVYL